MPGIPRTTASPRRSASAPAARSKNRHHARTPGGHSCVDPSILPLAADTTAAAMEPPLPATFAAPHTRTRCPAKSRQRGSGREDPRQQRNRQGRAWREKQFSPGAPPKDQVTEDDVSAEAQGQPWARRQSPSAPSPSSPPSFFDEPDGVATPGPAQRQPSSREDPRRQTDDRDAPRAGKPRLNTGRLPPGVPPWQRVFAAIPWPPNSMRRTTPAGITVSCMRGTATRLRCPSRATPRRFSLRPRRQGALRHVARRHTGLQRSDHARRSGLDPCHQPQASNPPTPR